MIVLSCRVPSFRSYMTPALGEYVPRPPVTVGRRRDLLRLCSCTTGELTSGCLEALDSSGQRTPYIYKGQHKKRWRKNVGMKAGAVFMVSKGGDPLVLYEAK